MYYKNATSVTNTLKKKNKLLIETKRIYFLLLYVHMYMPCYVYEYIDGFPRQNHTFKKNDNFATVPKKGTSHSEMVACG